MPLVRVHEASDGQLFKSYDDYVAHEENLMFESNWQKLFDDVAFESASQEATFKAFVKAHQDRLTQVFQNSKVKRKGGKK